MVESVMIDAVRYQVERTDATIVCDGHECGASVDYNTGIIQIRDSEVVGRGTKARLLMHEIVHAVLFERGRREEAENEELVDALAAGIVNLVRQNPELVEFIKKS